MDKRLRYVSEEKFAQPEPLESGRALEWRRSFNVVRFTLRTPSISRHYTANELDYGGDDGRPGDAVKPRMDAFTRLVFDGCENDDRDTLRCIGGTRTDDGLHDVVRPKQGVQIIISDRAIKDRPGSGLSCGAYDGVAFHSDFDGADVLSIDLAAPSEHVEAAREALKSGDANALKVSIALRSFTYEVDDALREWYDPRDILVHGAAPAALLSMVTASEPSADVDDTEAEPVRAGEVAPQAQPLATDYMPLLKGIRTALWVIAVALAIGLLK